MAKATRKTSSKSEKKKKIEGKKLVVVESPTKSRTLKKFLGRDYKVVASGGHIADLPAKTLAVNLEKDFAPTYRVIPGKEKTISKLKEETSAASEIYIASDPDREGEAIAWHIVRVLKLPGDKVHRVVFNEITRSAVLGGMKHPRSIDMNLVNAQQARRILDRLVGYKVSPVLWYALYKGLSAGRVQTVALRLIFEREMQIKAFVPQKYWEILAKIGYDSAFFDAQLSKIDGKTVKIGSIPTQKDADVILKELEGAEATVLSLVKKKTFKSPPPPFKTSTLQLRASSELGFPAAKTMRIAQRLYEGIPLGDEGPVGLITYMRTDSLRIAEEALKESHALIEKKFGNEYLKPRRFKSGKGAQDAHEAIRPSSALRTPEKVKPYLEADAYKLYSLIYNRFLASQMAAAIFGNETMRLSSGRFELKSQTNILEFDGYIVLYPKELESAKKKSVSLPSLKKGSRVKIVNAAAEAKETKPPARFTEGTLVQELEKNGVGRPSTYAQIINTLLSRKYVHRQKKTLFLTELGEKVWSILADRFKHLFNISFTAEMEDELDKVESGEKVWVQVLRDFYGPFEEELQKVLDKRKELKKEFEKKTDEICPKCGSPLIVKWGPQGRFLACSAFPKCRYTKPLPGEELEIPDYIKNRKCPKCGAPLTVKRNKYGGRFIGCTAFPDCDYIEPYDLGFPCPREKCDGHLVERRSHKGRRFIGCSNYPDCDFVSWYDPVDEKCPECGAYPVFVKKKQKTVFCAICGWSEKREKV